VSRCASFFHHGPDVKPDELRNVRAFADKAPLPWRLFSSDVADGKQRVSGGLDKKSRSY